MADDPALTSGRIAAVRALGTVLTYERQHEGRRVLVLLETGGRPASVDLATIVDPGIDGGRILISSGLDRSGTLGQMVELRADEALVVELTTRP